MWDNVLSVGLWDYGLITSYSWVVITFKVSKKPLPFLSSRWPSLSLLEHLVPAVRIIMQDSLSQHEAFNAAMQPHDSQLFSLQQP